MNTINQIITYGDKHMNTNRQIAVFVGVMFILASATAILGFLLYQPILTGPDYLTNGAENSTQVVLGALMELALVVTAIGTAIGLFPILRPYGERIALGHLCFRFLEAVVISVGIVAVLSLLILSKDFMAANAANASAYHVSGTLLQAVYKTTSMLGPLFLLGINTLMYSYLLFKSRLVPRPLAVMGLTGATLVLVYAMLVLFGVVVHGSGPATILALPIALYEMLLAVRLIAKGFNPSAVVFDSAKQPASSPLLNVA